MKNINYLKRFLLIVFYSYLLMCNRPLHAQIIYGFGVSLSPSNGNQMFQINLATCEICLVATLTNSFGANSAATILTNGNVITVDGGFIRMYDPPNPNAVTHQILLPTSVIGPQEFRVYWICFTGMGNYTDWLFKEACLICWPLMLPIQQHLRFLHR